MPTLIRKRRKGFPDPAPSRLSYRFQRLMLTPLFRIACRVGIPFALTLGATTWYLSDEGRRDAMNGMIIQVREQIESRPEFMVNLMSIEGASPGVETDIREIVPVDLPASSFDLDLGAIRQSVVDLDAVESASVRIRPGGVLAVEVRERVPVLAWKTMTGFALLDRNGVAVARLGQGDQRPGLPLVAGAGADRAVLEALALLAAARPIAGRIRGLERMGQRRWDLVLDRNQRILLPAKHPVAALDRVIAMDAAQDILARDIAAVDLRLPDRPTLRLNQAALEELWRIRNVDEEEQ